MKKIKLLITFTFLLTFISFINISQAISLSPDKYFVNEVQEGKSYQNKITLYGYTSNEPQENQELFLSVVGMQKLGEEDDRNFYAPNPTSEEEVANWVTLEKTQVTVPPQKEININWNLTPKGKAKCGTNLAAIMVSSAPNSTEANNVVAFKDVIAQIHVGVTESNGNKCDNKVNLSLLDFKIKNGKNLFFNPDIPFVTRIKNDGNLISRGPQGFIEIFGYGDKVTIPFNPEKLDVYPDTVRKLDNHWLDENYPKNGNFFKKVAYEATHLRIGRYKARLGITKNTSTQLTSFVSFWIIPWRLLLIVLVIVLLVGTLIYQNFRNKRELKSIKKNSRKL